MNQFVRAHILQNTPDDKAIREWRQRLHELMEEYPYFDKISILNLADTPPHEPMWNDFHPFGDDPNYVAKLRKLYPCYKAPEWILDLGYQAILSWKRAKPWQLYFKVPWELRPKFSWPKCFNTPQEPKLYFLQRQIKVPPRKRRTRETD